MKKKQTQLLLFVAIGAGVVYLATRKQPKTATVTLPLPDSTGNYIPW